MARMMFTPPVTAVRARVKVWLEDGTVYEVEVDHPDTCSIELRTEPIESEPWLGWHQYLPGPQFATVALYGRATKATRRRRDARADR